jgi:hypothetical protein
MVININIKQIGNRKKIAPVPFTYPRKPATVRQLITDTVQICVEDYNCRVRAGDSGISPLSADRISDMAQVGKIAFGINYGGKEQELEPAVNNAIQAFEDGLYRIFQGENELEGLETPIDINDNDELTFIRLTMLTGRMW